VEGGEILNTSLTIQLSTFKIKNKYALIKKITIVLVEENSTIFQNLSSDGNWFSLVSRAKDFLC